MSLSEEKFLTRTGRDDGLFRGAMAESGFGGMLDRHVGGFNATKLMQETYNNLVSNTSCADLLGKPESLTCLRDAPFEDINHALNVTGVGPWAPTLDGDFFQDFAANQLSEGKFVQVPILIGANSDEGTAFGQGLGPNGGVVNTDADFRYALASRVKAENTDKTAEQLEDELMYLYPNIQSRGIPSLEIWSHVIQANDTFAQNLGLQYRRISAIAGDITMHYRRRRANIAWSNHGVPNYAYRFNVVVNGLDDSTGVTHFQEVSSHSCKSCRKCLMVELQVAFVFLNTNGDGYAVNPFGGNGTYPRKAKALAKTMSTAWINFVTGLDPNGKKGLVCKGDLEWPIYTTSAGGGVGEEIVFDVEGSYVETDDFRAEGINWMIENSLAVFGS